MGGMAMARGKRKQRREANIVVMNPGVKCPHCGERHNHRITNTYPNGRRRRMCSNCGRPFIDMEATSFIDSSITQ